MTTGGQSTTWRSEKGGRRASGRRTRKRTLLQPGLRGEGVDRHYACNHLTVGTGPITIYDKSTVQSFSMDESVWLDAFFLVNVVPLFYVETLADLEKKMAGGKSPEDLVGMLAAKTPSNAVPNSDHRSLIASELTGGKVPLDGRVLLQAVT